MLHDIKLGTTECIIYVINHNSKSFLLQTNLSLIRTFNWWFFWLCGNWAEGVELEHHNVTHAIVLLLKILYIMIFFSFNTYFSLLCPIIHEFYLYFYTWFENIFVQTNCWDSVYWRHIWLLNLKNVLVQKPYGFKLR